MNKKRARVKSISIPDNLSDFVDGFSNFNGAVTWMLRQLKDNPDSLKQLENATGITHKLPTKSDSLTINPASLSEQPNACGNDANEWAVKV